MTDESVVGRRRGVGIDRIESSEPTAGDSPENGKGMS